MDTVSTRRNNKRKGCRRNFLRGGASIPEGGAYSVGGPLVPGLANASVINPISACQSAMRPMPPFSSSAGIPGMRGGKKYRVSRRKQRGGRYEMTPEVTSNGIPLLHATPIPCERGGSPTESTSPMYYVTKGGFNNSLTIPTAAYTHAPSDFLTSSGTPLMLNVLVNGRTCGGRRKGRKSKDSRKVSRKVSRKASRKASRKSKASRKH